MERHPARAATLRERFGDVTVVGVDASDLRLPRRPFHVGGEPIGEPTNHYGCLVSAAESAEQAKQKRVAVSGWTYPLEPLVANPPFAITSDVLRRLLRPGSRLVAATLVLDERAVFRWSGPGAPAAQRWRLQFDVTVGDRLPRAAFHPPPQARCRVLVVRRRTR